MAFVMAAVGLALFVLIVGFRVRTEAKSAVSDVHSLQQSADPTAARHWTRYAELRIWYTVYKAQVIFVLMEYRVALPTGNSPVVHVQVGMCAHGCGVRFDVNPWGVSPQAWNGIVEFDTRATRQEKEAALALNIDCFASAGRCNDIADVLPTIWSRVGRNTVQSRLMGLAQDLGESHRLTSPYE